MGNSVQNLLFPGSWPCSVLLQILDTLSMREGIRRWQTWVKVGWWSIVSIYILLYWKISYIAQWNDNLRCSKQTSHAKPEPQNVTLPLGRQCLLSIKGCVCKLHIYQNNHCETRSSPPPLPMGTSEMLAIRDNPGVRKELASLRRTLCILTCFSLYVPCFLRDSRRIGPYNLPIEKTRQSCIIF